MFISTSCPSRSAKPVRTAAHGRAYCLSTPNRGQCLSVRMRNAGCSSMKASAQSPMTCSRWRVVSSGRRARGNRKAGVWPMNPLLHRRRVVTDSAASRTVICSQNSARGSNKKPISRSYGPKALMKSTSRGRKSAANDGDSNTSLGMAVRPSNVRDLRARGGVRDTASRTAHSMSKWYNSSSAPSGSQLSSSSKYRRWDHSQPRVVLGFRHVVIIILRRM
ncbi:hypothetical protein DFH07DRAFT_787370 [Mycena maculata]|uniref:Uncharacterized protein n=1 Tax=Mycena maculata TaxID=230809 RepID=A0AAD7P2V2_9AGAR|nr:hypothetical protein DFH07DRAFT_787370 [Mycena maculata]